MTDWYPANPWIITLRDRTPPLRWDAVFPEAVDSVELEVGSGKGMFLRRAAAASPRTGFLGIERAGKFLRICGERLARDGRPNARVVRADAFDLLARWVPIGGLAAVHIYFPDPWPKKRHAKRRLLSRPLFDLVARALMSGGTLTIATDVGPSFDQTAAELRHHPGFERLALDQADRDRMLTNYAIKYAKEGRMLHAGRWARTAAPPPPIPPPPSRRRRPASTAPSPSPEAAP